MTQRLQVADIFFTRGSGLLSKAIRYFTRAIGESRTKVNHVGLVVKGGPVGRAVVVEALIRVKEHRLYAQYGGRGKRTSVAVYRPMDLTAEEINVIVATAKSYVGRRYGFLKIAAHLADWLLQGAYVFRRLAVMDDYPICSWVVAHAFKKAGKNFGVPPGAASPDDIWDFVTTNPDKYVEVRPLNPL